MSTLIEPLVMPYEGRNVPHAVIEVNQRCNISCTACYKDKSTYTKPLEQVLAEIELAAAERNLSVLTLAGGEPVLHPQLPEIVAFVKSRGIQPQMLSNGLALTEEKLRELQARGLARVYLHVDSLQRRPDAPRKIESEKELDELREKIAAKVEAAGIRCALSFTVYKTKNYRDLAHVAKFVLDSPRFDRLLVTCCTDFAAIGKQLAVLGKAPAELGLTTPDLRADTVKVTEVEELLRKELGIEPYAFLGSSKSLTERRWIFYYAFVLYGPDGKRELFPLGPAFGRVVQLGNTLGKAFKGKYPIEQEITPTGAVALLLAYAGASGDSQEAARTLSFIGRTRARGSKLMQKSLIFQQGPNLTPEGELEICRHCPDSTIRDGKLVPVCLVDVLAPMA